MKAHYNMSLADTFLCAAAKNLSATIATKDGEIRELLNSGFILPEGMTLSYDGRWGEVTKTVGTFVPILTLAARPGCARC
jgi:hypothetical protein